MAVTESGLSFMRQNLGAPLRVCVKCFTGELISDMQDFAESAVSCSVKPGINCPDMSLIITDAPKLMHDQYRTSQDTDV